MVARNKTIIHSRTLGKFIEEVENRLIDERRDLSKYIDSLSTELNVTKKYSDYLAERLDDALTRISKLENP